MLAGFPETAKLQPETNTICLVQLKKDLTCITS
jgi:hypothetical protein